MPTFLVQTLGCKLNQLESEAITDAFSNKGYSYNPKDESPSLIIINTCTVTSKADQKARRVIRKALRDYPCARVIVTGCYAQLNKDDIIKLETDGKGRLSVIGKDKIISHDKNDLFQFNPKKFSQHTRSFLKIQDGCDKNCTYCKIRLARGKSVSLDKDEVLSRLRILEKNHAEAVLTGVNISQYKDDGTDNIFNLSALLEYLLSGTERIAIRLSSLAPESIDERLVKVLSHPRIRPHFHLSVQSCSNIILDKMARAYNSQTVKRAAGLLRGAKNAPFLACDIIAGFPGETEIEFNETFSICKELDFAWIHVFPFSKRQGTPAFSFKNTVTESEVTKRVNLLTNLAKQGREDYVRRWLGKDVDALVEKDKLKVKDQQQNICFGTSENYLKVKIQYEGVNPPLPGSVLRCRLTNIGDFKNCDVTAVILRK
ncbi:MAG: tRNA (N(6)-L-threonylcarbamoyladenosine(37)-C(2))-methylthiotransferase MtaB [Treponema sp.]|nr:tRNA (N(6)-L-threonylcarbamoyladenosine(37)-C(2))-methylthiotransferase MtaB [Treponema sp.]